MFRLGSWLSVLLLLPLAVLVAAADLPPETEAIRLVVAGRETEALALTRDWSLAHPASAEGLLLNARMQFSLGDLTGALEALDAAYFLTRDPAVRLRQARLLLDGGRLAEAQTLLEEILRHQEGDAAAHALLALVLQQQGRSIEAAASARVAQNLDPTAMPVQLTLALLTYEVGDLAQAEELLLNLIRRYPAAPEAYRWLGQLYWQTGRFDPARSQWRRLISLDPLSPQVWLLRHNLYLIRGPVYPCTGFYPTFAPDGGKVAFRGRGDAGGLYVAPREAPQQEERVYLSTGSLYSLDWSPDSRALLCREYLQQTVNDKKEYTYRLFIVRLEPGYPVIRLYEGKYIGTASWHPDGRQVVFDTHIANRGRALFALPADGSGTPNPLLTPVKNEYASACLWSTDGQYQVLQRWSATSQQYELARLNPADRSQDRLLAASRQAFYSPVFLPRSPLLAYLERDASQQWSLMVVPATGDSPPRALYHGLRQIQPPAFTADGQHLLLTVGAEMRLFSLAGLDASR
jgi:tetratricopeptide (TPR) repeat protein